MTLNSNPTNLLSIPKITFSILSLSSIIKHNGFIRRPTFVRKLFHLGTKLGSASRFPFLSAVILCFRDFGISNLSKNERMIDSGSIYQIYYLVSFIEDAIAIFKFDFCKLQLFTIRQSILIVTHFNKILFNVEQNITLSDRKREILHFWISFTLSGLINYFLNLLR